MRHPTRTRSLRIACPSFTVNNVGHTFSAAGTVLHEFQVASTSAFSTILAQRHVAGDARADLVVPLERLPEGNLVWRARAPDPSNRK